MTMYVNYVVGNRRSEALLRRSTHGHVGLGIAQEIGVVLLIASGALQTIAHDSLSLSFSLAASCQLCRSLARRIRASIQIAIPLSRFARAINESRVGSTAAARQRCSTHARTCSLPFHRLDRRSPRRDNIRRRLVARAAQATLGQRDRDTTMPSQ